RNRLMGNALLELVAFGRRAGAAAARRAETPPTGPIGVTHLSDWQRALIAAGLPLEARAPRLFPPYSNFDLEAALDAGGVRA
ncbi:MAG: L-aspartate oxidase, partial [Deltaproteobacteria bacterium]|nr:L-aspartate oxidase [Deltaproteobacteria bacterium]